MKFFKALLFIVKLVNLFGFRNKFQNKIIKNKLINNKYDNFNHQKNVVLTSNQQNFLSKFVELIVDSLKKSGEIVFVDSNTNDFDIFVFVLIEWLVKARP